MQIARTGSSFTFHRVQIVETLFFQIQPVAPFRICDKGFLIIDWVIHPISWRIPTCIVPIAKNGGSDAEFESAIYICPAAGPSTIDYRCNFNRIDGGHDSLGYAGRSPVVPQKSRSHQLYVPNPERMSRVHQRKRRQLRPPASLEG